MAQLGGTLQPSLMTSSSEVVISIGIFDLVSQWNLEYLLFSHTKKCSFSPHQSGFDPLGELLVQGVDVVPLGRQLRAVLKFHLRDTVCVGHSGDSRGDANRDRDSCPHGKVSRSRLSPPGVLTLLACELLTKWFTYHKNAKHPIILKCIDDSLYVQCTLMYLA